nr:unnamed protein product [Callosobruchus analis]
MSDELLTSSSSDEEEIEACLVTLQATAACVSKIRMFVEDVVHKLTEEEFRKHFRLSRASLNNVICEYGNSNFYFAKNTWLRGTQITPAETEVLMFVWYAANHVSVRDVAQRFNVAVSTCHKAIDKVIEFLVMQAPVYVKFPETELEKEQMSSGFEAISSFPCVLGCIDGTLIPVVTPAHKIKATYVNRHDQTCLTLQGICDFKKCFTDVFTGVPAVFTKFQH